MSFIPKLDRSSLVPKGVRYIPVEKMLRSLKKKSAYAAGANTWTPTDAQLLAAATGSFSMLSFVKKILNQGGLGACTAFGWAGAVAVFYAIKTGSFKLLSMLYIYYYERLSMGKTDEDSGAECVDGANVLTSRGAPLESSYPYNDDGVVFKQEPPAVLDAEASKNKIVNPLQVSPITAHIKAALKAQYPVIFGFMVYDSFESSATARTGIVKMPKPSEAMLGGHCTYAIGYTDSTGAAHFEKTSDALFYRVANLFSFVSQALRGRGRSKKNKFAVTPPPNCLIGVNSWGRGWGDGGVFYMPWEYVTQYAADFYIFTDVTLS